MISVLIPTDFSENAMNALKFALELFKHEKSTVFYFLHAYEDDVYADESHLNRDNFEEVLEGARKQSKSKLKKFLEAAKTIAPNPRYTFHTISAYNNLIDEADTLITGKNIDLVVMGTKGETNAKSVTFGSNTLHVIKYVDCPVFAIPAHYEYQRPKHVVFATNFMVPYKRKELKLLSKITAPYRGVIDLLYNSKSNKLSIRQQDNKAFIIESLPDNKVNFVRINSKNLTEAISTYMKKNDTNLLVMVNTRHSYLEDILYRSIVDEITLNLEVPFLAMQNIERN